ncbi:MAG: (Fe-S)-binding protein [Firmicutes bacterium]|nr:(Fe-S)-binding protein [Bacillota bacterium]
MKTLFAPGCALLIYKPALGEKVLKFLKNYIGDIDKHITCCRHDPNLDQETQIINICPGCDKRYRQLYEGVSTISFWEVLADFKNFPFPDYKGKKMTILDACPARNKDGIHKAIRTLLEKMNIELVEPERTRTKSVCCGDSFYGVLSVEEVKKKMRVRADEMPVEEVVVYCVSCCKSMYIGGKKPRYLVDLLFDEETIIGTYEPDEWHKEIDEFISSH